MKTALLLVLLSACFTTPPPENARVDPTWYARIKPPLKVYWPSVWSDAHDAATVAALRSFPCGLFVPTADPSTADVLIRYRYRHTKPCGDQPRPVGKYARAWAFRCDGPAEIYLHLELRQYDQPMFRVAITHELGHIAGLDHDAPIAIDAPSVMAPDVLRYRELSSALDPHLTEDDLAWLTHRYCTKEITDGGSF